MLHLQVNDKFKRGSPTDKEKKAHKPWHEKLLDTAEYSVRS